MINRDRHLGGHNVIFRSRIVGLIESQIILLAFVDQFRMQWAKLAVRTGISEVEGELTRLHLYRNRVRGGWFEVDLSPCFGSENTQGQDFCAHQ